MDLPKGATGEGRSAPSGCPRRDPNRRIISMRYGHADEEAYYQEQMDRPR